MRKDILNFKYQKGCQGFVRSSLDSPVIKSMVNKCFSNEKILMNNRGEKIRILTK